MIVKCDVVWGRSQLRIYGDSRPDDASEGLPGIYKNWDIERCVIGAKIDSYYSKPVYNNWKEFHNEIGKYMNKISDEIKSGIPDRNNLEIARQEITVKKSCLISIVLKKNVVKF